MPNLAVMAPHRVVRNATYRAVPDWASVTQNVMDEIAGKQEGGRKWDLWKANVARSGSSSTRKLNHLRR